METTMARPIEPTPTAEVDDADDVNPSYTEESELRNRVAELEKQLRDYPYGICDDCGSPLGKGRCPSPHDNDDYD